MGPQAKSSKKGLIEARVKRILPILKKTYPNARCSLDFENPYQLLVATILSAQCTDERVNIVTPALFSAYPDFKSLSKADPEKLEKLIQSTGFYKNKTKSLLECSQSIMRDHGGEIPRNIDEFVKLRGVGRKTANVVLGNAFDIASGVVVDTHVGRLSKRLGLTTEDNPEKVERDLTEIVPKKDWIMFSHYLVFHGRARFRARNPDCPSCELIEICPKIGVDYKPNPSEISYQKIMKRK